MTDECLLEGQCKSSVVGLCSYQHYFNKYVSWTLPKGTPRATTDSFEDGLKYPKQIKRESPPIRAFEGAITKGKPYDGITTIKEMGRSIHEIPRQDILTQESRKTPEVVQSTRPIIEGSISQVNSSQHFLSAILLRLTFMKHSKKYDLVVLGSSYVKLDIR